MKEPSIEEKQQILREFLYHIRKDKRVDAQENKLFKLSFKYMNLTREQVLSIDSEVKENIGDSCEDGSFEVVKFYENLKEYHLSLVQNHLEWFTEYAGILDSTAVFNEVFDLAQNKPEVSNDVDIETDCDKPDDEFSGEKATVCVDPAVEAVAVEVSTLIEPVEVLDKKSIKTVNGKQDYFALGLEELNDNQLQAAIDFFQQGIDANDGVSIVEMAKLLEDCSSPNYCPVSAYKIYTDLSIKGSGEATRNVAIMTMEGRGIGINSPKAVSILKKAISQGDTASNRLLENLLMTLTPEELEKAELY